MPKITTPREPSSLSLSLALTHSLLSPGGIVVGSSSTPLSSWRPILALLARLPFPSLTLLDDELLIPPLNPSIPPFPVGVQQTPTSLAACARVCLPPPGIPTHAHPRSQCMCTVDGDGAGLEPRHPPSASSSFSNLTTPAFSPSSSSAWIPDGSLTRIP